jgi:hypothetical protein
MDPHTFKIKSRLGLDPLYLARQRYSVAFLMTYLLAVPAMLEVGNSDSAMIRTI